MGSRGPQSAAEVTTTKSHRLPTQRGSSRKLRGTGMTFATPVKPVPIVQAPKHLKPETKAWWQTIVEMYEIGDHQFKILLMAAEALDRREQARAALTKHGLTYKDPKGMIRARPEVAIERECSTAFLRALRALKLEAEALP